MTQRAIDLLASWVAENVKPLPPEQREGEAGRLATRFTTYAADSGFGPAELAELEEELAEDLVTYMSVVLDEAADTASL